MELYPDLYPSNSTAAHKGGHSGASDCIFTADDRKYSPNTFSPNTFSPNTFSCWLTATSETPHRMTLFLKLHHPPKSPSDYHLHAEVFKEKWGILKDQPLPWKVDLDPLRLILLE